MNAVLVIVLTVLIGAMLLGLALGQTGILNRDLAAARADEIRARIAENEAWLRQRLMEAAEEARHRQALNELTERGYALFIQTIPFLVGFLTVLVSLTTALHLLLRDQARLTYERRLLIEAENQRWLGGPAGGASPTRTQYPLASHNPSRHGPPAPTGRHPP